IPGFVWFVLKIMMGIWLYIWLRATLPRLRYDALMGLGWKRMLPLGRVWVLVLAGANLYLQPNTDVVTESPAPAAQSVRPTPPGGGMRPPGGGMMGGGMMPGGTAPPRTTPMLPPNQTVQPDGARGGQ